MPTSLQDFQPGSNCTIVFLVGTDSPSGNPKILSVADLAIANADTLTQYVYQDSQNVSDTYIPEMFNFTWPIPLGTIPGTYFVQVTEDSSGVSNGIEYNKVTLGVSIKIGNFTIPTGGASTSAPPESTAAVATSAAVTTAPPSSPASSTTSSTTSGAARTKGATIVVLFAIVAAISMLL